VSRKATVWSEVEVEVLVRDDGVGRSRSIQGLLALVNLVEQAETTATLSCCLKDEKPRGKQVGDERAASMLVVASQGARPVSNASSSDGGARAVEHPSRPALLLRCSALSLAARSAEGQQLKLSSIAVSFLAAA
jgi:hypothetical protein